MKNHAESTGQFPKRDNMLQVMAPDHCGGGPKILTPPPRATLLPKGHPFCPSGNLCPGATPLPLGQALAPGATRSPLGNPLGIRLGANPSPLGNLFAPGNAYSGCLRLGAQFMHSSGFLRYSL